MSDSRTVESNLNSPQKKRHCVVCGKRVPPSRRTHCSDQCMTSRATRNARFEPPPLVGSYDLLPAHLRNKFAQGPKEDCWIWQGGRGPYGYPNGTSVKGFKGAPYRLIYMMMVGSVRPRWHLHHTCNNGMGGCVNPYHLVPLPPGAHSPLGDSPHARHARQTHCKNGHEFTPENTIPHTQGKYGRRCKICKEAAIARWRERHPGRAREQQKRYESTPEAKALRRARQRRRRAELKQERLEREAS